MPIAESDRVAHEKESNMEILVSVCIVVLCGFAVAAQRAGTPDESLLRPSNPAYPDAIEFARFLNEHNIAVQSAHSSKLNGFFRDLPKAAYFKTDKGILEVIFFPDNGAEKVSVTEVRDGSRYIYSFTGQPRPNPPGNTFNAAFPVYFVKRGGWFVVTYNKDTFAAVEAAFSKT
jgi:hypothetical protein